MITRLAKSSLAQDLPRYRSMLAGNDAFIPSSYESIASASGTGSNNSITFSSIPSTYTSLQIRYCARGTNANQSDALYVRLNGDSGANKYNFHGLRGDGSTASASGDALAYTRGYVSAGNNDIPSGGTSANLMGVGILDLHDYTSTTRLKTMRAMTGWEINSNGVGFISLGSFLYNSTSAITSIEIGLTTGTNYFATSSVISLYGIKGA